MGQRARNSGPVLHVGGVCAAACILALWGCAAKRSAAPADPAATKPEVTKMAVETDPSSRSLLRRASDILLVRVDAVRPGEWAPGDDGWLKRTVELDARLEQRFKGPARPGEREPFRADIRQFKTASVAMIPPPGVWSALTLEPGGRLVVFASTTGGTLTDVLQEPACELVRPADEVLPSVRLAAERLTLADLLARATPQAQSLNYLFSEYLWATYQTEALQTLESFDRLLGFAELPELPTAPRSSLMSLVYSRVLADQALPDGFRNRMVVCMFRLLRLPQARDMHDNLVQVYLPNLLRLGREDEAPLSAGGVFQDAPDERRAAADNLRQYQGAAPAGALAGWLAQ